MTSYLNPGVQGLEPQIAGPGLDKSLRGGSSQGPSNQPKTASFSTTVDLIDELIPIQPARTVGNIQKLNSGYKIVDGSSKPLVWEKTIGQADSIPQPINLGGTRHITEYGLSNTNHKTQEAKQFQRPPFPPRPERANVDIPGTSTDGGRTVASEEVQAKPYELEVPRITPQYQNNTPADFFPWAGNHPEDILSEQSSKSGYFDKIQIAPTEFNTARPTVWSGLKYKPGLQILSSLLVSALGHRQVQGTVAPNSSFKPPPRVTLTDTKREAWLRDLANPTIPLRRLSRTIPHGIRGRSLLDHCLSKRIPTWRAVWLAKCVGANEVRAFKRKGTSGSFAIGGETKWIKDWTTNVEQFLEVLLDSCGLDEWKVKLTYSLQLITHLYSEHLLDQEHFLDWMITSFCTCEMHKVPVWLIIARIYWKEIWRFRHRGQRLAEGMLGHLHSAGHLGGVGINDFVLQKLEALTRSCVTNFPDCFLLPKCWLKYQATLSSYIGKSDRTFDHCYGQLLIRNARLIRKSDGVQYNDKRMNRMKLISLLDDASLLPHFTSLSEACLQAVHDEDLLVATLLEWASTLHRFGADRPYIAIRLLREWGQFGIRIDQSLLSFLGRYRSGLGLNRASIFKVVAELAQSHHFSISKYLQWLMARKPRPHSICPNDNEDLPSMLLLELALHNLPPHVLSLRNTLLLNMGQSIADERKNIEMVKRYLAKAIPTVFGPIDGLDSPLLLGQLPKMKGTVKSEISHYIFQRLDLIFHSSYNYDDSHFDQKLQSRSLSIEEFERIRDILVSFGEFSVLANVISFAADLTDGGLLVAATDTVNWHFNVFRAIGIAEELFETLLARSSELHRRTSSDIPLLLSLVDLGEQLCNRGREVSKLRKEALSCEEKPALAACSPVSDNVAEVLESSGYAFVEEMEQHLNSGNSMDRQTLSNLFATITQKIQKMWIVAEDDVIGLFNLLKKLRSFDEESFDIVLLSWLERVLHLPNRPKLGRLLVPLVCLEIMDFTKFMTRAVSSLAHSDDLHMCSKLVIELLTLLTYLPSCSDAWGLRRTYRFHFSQTLVVQKCPSVLTFLVTKALEPDAHQHSLSDCIACATFSTAEFSNMLQAALVCHRDLATRLADYLDHEAPHRPLVHLIDRVLAPLLQRVDVIDKQVIRDLLDFSSEFNIELCQLKLRAMLNKHIGGPTKFGVSCEGLIALLVEQATSLDRKPSEMLVPLISKLSQDQAMNFHEHATATLLTTISDTEADRANLRLYSCAREMLLESIDVVERKISHDRQSAIASRIEDNMSTLLSVPQLDRSKLSSSQTHGIEKADELYSWIDTLLQLIVIHQNMLQHATVAPALPLRLLVNLGLLLVNPVFTSHPPLSVYILDTMALLSDGLPYEARSLAVRALLDQHRVRDRRIEFVLGYSTIMESDLLSISASVSTSPGNSNQIHGPDFEEKNFPYPVRRWEMVQDAMPNVGENDTCLSLSLFGARKAVV